VAAPSTDPAAEAAGARSAVDALRSRWARLVLGRRTLITYAGVSLLFEALLYPAYLFGVGTRPDVGPEFAQRACLLAAAAFCLWLGALHRLVARLNWSADESFEQYSDAALRAEAATLDRLPWRTAALWSMKWSSEFTLFALWSGEGSAWLSEGLFVATMLLGPLPLGHAMTVWLGRRELGRVCEALRRRGLSPDLPHAPLARRLVLSGMALVIVPSLYMAAMAASPNAGRALAREWLVALFFGAIILFGVLCSLLLSVTLTAPLQALTRVVRHITRQGEVGQVSHIAQERTDEIGALVASTNEMIDRLNRTERERGAALHSLETLNERLEAEVEQRTQRLTQANEALARAIRDQAQANADMRLVLDSVGQGFLSADRAGVVTGKHSTKTEDWFGPLAPGSRLWDYLGARDRRFALQLEAAWMGLADDALPLEVVLGNCPERLRLGALTLQIEYRPLWDRGTLAGVVLVVSDVSAAIEAERAALAQHELTQLLDHLVRDRNGVIQFVREARRIVEALGRGSPDAARLLHTLKGSAGQYGITSVARACQDLEEQLAESAGSGERPDYGSVCDAWQAFIERARALVHMDQSPVDISERDLYTLREHVAKGTPRSVLDRLIAELRYEPIARPLERAANKARELALRLGKGAIETSVEADELRFAPERWGQLWAASLHAVRNAVDHGLETPEERLASGKALPGRIALSAHLDTENLVISVADDGRGVDWAGVAQRARQAGLPWATHEDLVAALFTDGITTSRVPSEISGRGLGLAALRSAVADLGGSIEIESAPERGTTLRMRLPQSTRLSLQPVRHPMD
jgi:HAMP domain-containing protein/HPt (histidine-containing phosphotransfer) domain-containing protein/two-component sensor histidine kinase